MSFFGGFDLLGDVGGGFLNTEKLKDISPIGDIGSALDVAVNTIYGLIPGGILSNILRAGLGSLGFIVDTVTGEKMAFQYNSTPSEQGGAEYAEQKCLGRSVPQLHYIGGKARTLDLPITFTMKEVTREDVKKNVRWLQALAYPDYQNDDEASLAPHPVVVIQGKLYTKDLWVVRDFSIKWGEAIDPITQIPSEATVNLTLVEVVTTGKSRESVIRL